MQQEQPQGLEFPTPGVVLLFGLHLASAASRMEEPLRSSDRRHGIRQEGPIVPAESMSLGLKVETNGPGLLQLGEQLIGELIGLSKKRSLVVWSQGLLLLLLLIICGSRLHQRWTN